MNQGHAALHEWVRRRIHSAVIAAIRADPQAVAVFVQDPPPGLDPHTRDFLRDARPLVLACAVALTAVLEGHRPDGPHCLACGAPVCSTLRRVAGVLAAYPLHPVPIDRAEAWRRADACLPRGHGPAVPIGIQPFEYGFVAWPASAAGEGAFVLVVDHITGAVTRWPRLPLDVLTREYGNHLTPCPGTVSSSGRGSSSAHGADT
ncbi:hypothetical protein [Actinomadura sp. 6K520]|uniref:hypothetical protein n=1 Tax=Actinomadura sp. 6K520 TaxID=2530364 RepID=UPI00104CFE37|nr:hypothetical protein [Actinomadura sp. 6K520]TDE34185.1 hypothetical protein E1289_10280 [Actinomadura sp. 6K520]